MKTKLSSDFKKISIMIFVIGVVLSALVSFIVFFLEKKERNQSYAEVAEQFDSVLINDFSNTEHYAVLLGRKILHVGPNKLEKIAHLVKEDIPDNITNIFSWTYFDWVDFSQNLLVNSKQGVLYEPIDLSSREYIAKTKHAPWKLILGIPSFGIPSGEYVIPAGLGVEDRDGKYAGTVAVELSIKKIRDKLKDIASDLHYEFFVVNTRGDILVSSNQLLTINNSFFKKLDLSSYHGKLKQPIVYSDDIEIEYIVNSKFYPFRILVGYNHEKVLESFFGDVTPKIIAILSLALISIYLLTSLRDKIIVPLESLYALSQSSDGDTHMKGFKYQEIAQLAKNIGRIQHFNKALQDEVTSRTLHLQQALQVKQEFLNNISHEIRTPLQGILGISSELYKRWEKIDEKDKKNYVRIISDSGERLMQLMSNVLDLSKLEESKMSFNFRLCDFRLVIDSSIKQMAALIESKKKINLEVDFAKNVNTKVKCDKVRMQQVINNLINNSYKYSSSGTVRILVQNKQDNLRVSVLDNGIGIPEDELEDIFKPFVESSKTKTKSGGKGLGLALCKEIIEAHKGKIWAENVEEGSAIHFEIPIR